MTVALVTGANRGIGREVARQLAQRGVTVLLGSRDPVRGKAVAAELAADGIKVVPVELDVVDATGVTSAAALIDREYGVLDILVNNAGIIAGAPAFETTADHLRKTFEVNVFGVVTTINAMLPLLRRSAAARIVNVSSTTASLALTSDRADLPGDASQRMGYCSAKAALNMLTVQYALAFECDPAHRHIKINSASPGYTATDMNNHRGTRTVGEGARAVLALAVLPDDGPTGGFFSDTGAIAW